MKKFLTVLLALSVVFTYSFSAVGTAFAADTTPEQYAYGKISAKATEVKANAAKSDYEAAAVDYAIKEATTAGYNAVKVLVEKFDIGGDAEDLAGFYAAVDNWCDDVSGNGDVSNGTSTYEEFDTIFNKEVVKKDHELKIEAAIAFINAIKVEDYVDADKETVKEYKVEAIEALKAVKVNGNTIKNLWTPDPTPSFGAGGSLLDINYVNAINIYLYGATASWSTVFTADSTMKEIKAGMTTGSVYGLVYALDLLTTVDEEKESGEVTDAYIENIIANITYNAKAASDGFYARHKVVAGDTVTKSTGYIALADGTKVYDVTVAKSKITAAEATAINTALMNQINTMMTVVEGYIKEVPNQLTGAAVKNELDKQVSWYAADVNFIPAMDWALKAVNMYEDVVAYGADLKAEVNYIGEKMYDDADIDEAVVNAKAVIYYNYFNAAYNKVESSYFVDVKPIHDPVAVAIRAAIEKWQDEITLSGPDKTAEADKKYCANYYAGYNANTVAPSSVDWQEEYAEIKDAAIEALYEVKTIAEVDAIMADADAALAKLRTAADDNGTLKVEVNKYVAALDKYANEQYELVKPGKAYRAESYLDKTANNGVTSAYEASEDVITGVATVGELASAYETAKGLFNKIKAIADLDAEAKAVNETVAKLPSVVTLEQEKVFMDANDALTAYLANYGAKETDVIGSYYALDTVMTTLKALQVKAVEDAIRELAKLKPIKADDKAAVQEVRDLYDRYYDYYEENFTVSNINDLKAYEEDVYNDEIAVVKAMVSKLTEASSIKDIMAAKTAYDALSGSQQRHIAKAYPYKIEMLNDRIIDAVKGLKITASSKAAKGSMTINWKVKGDASAADGFRVYRSKKMNSGYGKTYYFQTKDNTKRSYKNTKELKKGTRYHYKVRAYVVIDGKTYFSDFSNKAYRIAK